MSIRGARLVVALSWALALACCAEPRATRENLMQRCVSAWSDAAERFSENRSEDRGRAEQECGCIGDALSPEDFEFAMPILERRITYNSASVDDAYREFLRNYLMSQRGRQDTYDDVVARLSSVEGRLTDACSPPGAHFDLQETY